MGLKFREETKMVLQLQESFYGAETWTLRKVDQKHVESFEMWCWRRMEKISWIDHIKNEVLHEVKEKRNILSTVKKRRRNGLVMTCVGTAFCNTLLKGR